MEFHRQFHGDNPGNLELPLIGQATVQLEILIKEMEAEQRKTQQTVYNTRVMFCNAF